MPHSVAQTGMLRHRRRSLLIASGLAAVLTPVDLLLRKSSAASFALESAWVVVLAVAAFLQMPSAPRRAALVARLAGLLTGVLFSLIVWLTGGFASPYFSYLLAIPLSAIVVIPDVPSVAVLTAIGTTSGGIAILLRSGHGWRFVAAWSYLSLAASLLTVIAGSLFLHLVYAETRAVRARADAEKQRAEQVTVAHEEAKRSRDSLRQILVSIPDLVIVTRFDGSVAFVNGRIEQLFGIPPDAPLGTMAIRDRVLPEDMPVILHRRDALADGRRLEPTTIRVMGREGIRSCEINSLRLDFEGEPAIISVLRDVTEQRELQEKLLLTSRLASIGTLAAGVAHEINNPLSYILSNIRFISEGLATPLGDQMGSRWPEMAVAASEAVEGAERLRRIVLDLLAFSRPRNGSEQVDIHRVLDRAINIASAQIRSDARVVKDYGRVSFVHGDESRLAQVALNLIVNAAQAIQGDRETAGEIRVLTRTEPDGRVTFEVQDTGEGIATEVRNRIFEPFFTTKPSGTGLGLSVCHGIVRSLGGEITFDSKVGAGSSFRVTLPTSLSVEGAQRVTLTTNA